MYVLHFTHLALRALLRYKTWTFLGRNAVNTSQTPHGTHNGRLAPSPTGLMHLGNMWSFLWAWLWAKSAGGTIFLRMEDIDPDRSRKEFATAIEHDLQWLGLVWDGDIVYQSQRLKSYAQALNILEAQGRVYPCYCTRKELRALAGAPHVEDMGAPYSGRCAHLSSEERALKEAAGRKPSLRVSTSDAAGISKVISFKDVVYGVQERNLTDVGGDFALRRSDGVVAYQLAVVLDDAAANISHIVRGNDILASTPRQIFLQEILGLDKVQYAHLPLLLNDAGERLAKRHNALSIQALRDAGVGAERILGLFAYLAGYKQDLQPCSLQKLKEHFSFARCTGILQAQDIVVKNSHFDFLYGKT